MPLLPDETGRSFETPAVRSLRDRIAAAAAAVLVIAAAGAVLHRLQFSTAAVVDNDGYFHIKYSYLMSHGGGLIRELPWLQFTIHRDSYRDHHFLQHLLQMPFTFGDLRLGAKYAAWCFAVLAFASFYLAAALRGRVVAAILTLALLGGGNHFLYRMAMGRVPGLSLAALLLVIWLVVSRRERWLAVAMFGYVWLYDGFILGLLAVGALVLGEWLAEGRFNRRAVAWTLAGTAAGIVVNPYFPHNLESLAFNLTRTVGDAQLSVPDTGQEWKPLDTYYLLRKFRAVWVALALGLLLTALGRRIRGTTLGTLLFVMLTTVLMLKARRYADVWPPMVFLFLAFAWSDYWDGWRPRPAVHAGRRRVLATAALGGMLAFVPYGYSTGREMIEDEGSFEHYRGAAEFLEQHAQPKSVVFNADWDDFPFLFFFNSDVYYVVGLDQLYMARHDPALYDTWRRIRDGKVSHPARLIHQLFGAEFVVVNLADRGQRRFLERARADPAMRKVYDDERCAVLRISPERARFRGPKPA